MKTLDIDKLSERAAAAFEQARHGEGGCSTAHGSFLCVWCAKKLEIELGKVCRIVMAARRAHNREMRAVAARMKARRAARGN
jgi:hypothetical protein